MPFFVTEVKKGFAAIANAITTLIATDLGLRTDVDTARTEGIIPSRLPGLTGDAIANAGSNAVTLATVNSNVGLFGNATAVAAFTVDAKGRTTSAANVVITPAWTSITGKPTTLTGYAITDAEDFMQSLIGTDFDGLSYAVDGFNFMSNVGRRQYLDNSVSNTVSIHSNRHQCGLYFVVCKWHRAGVLYGNASYE